MEQGQTQARDSKQDAHAQGASVYNFFDIFDFYM
jgi:hypothetical protein